jgi:large subunit ribosomal protein L29
VKAADIRNLDSNQIHNKIAELKAELFNLRFQHAVGQLENTARLRTVKKTIAQMKTIISERGE